MLAVLLNKYILLFQVASPVQVTKVNFSVKTAAVFLIPTSVITTMTVEITLMKWQTAVSIITFKNPTVNKYINEILQEKAFL